MTEGSILAKYTGERRDDAGSSNDNEGTDDLGAFGWLRGVRDRAIMLELRHRDGRVTAFGYAWLERVDFDPSDGITLHFPGKSVRIAGRNLNAESRPNVRLLAGILRHRVPWVQEADEPAVLQSKKGATLVEELNLNP